MKIEFEPSIPACSGRVGFAPKGYSHRRKMKSTSKCAPPDRASASAHLLGERRSFRDELPLLRCLLRFVMSAALLHHFFELLLLGVIQHSFDLVLAVLHDCMRLGPAVLLRERTVTAQRLHLLSAILQHGLDLCYLLVGQIEFLAKMPRHAIGIWRMMGTRLIVLRGLCRARGLLLIRDLCQCRTCSKHCAHQHRYGSCMHMVCFLLYRQEHLLIGCL